MRTGIAEFKPQRLTEAREALAITKATLADMVGVTSATISKWESGKQLPEEKLLTVLSERMGHPSHWFTMSSDADDSNSTTHFYRSNSSTTKGARTKAKIKLKWAARITKLLTRWIDFPPINIPEFGEKDFLSISDTEIQDLAKECRELWGLSDLPIQNVVLAMESAGITVIRTDLGQTKMDGVSCWSDGRPFVFISSDKANGIRNRFDAAHELFHVIAHKDVSEADYNKHYKKIEQDANLFASCFLLPETTFSEDITLTTLDGLLAIKSRWKTSVAAMIYRCHDLDIIDADQKLRLYKSKSARGWSKREPKDDLPPEEPRLLHRSVKMLVDNNVISKASLLDEIALPAIQVDKICGLDNYFSEMESPEENLVTLKIPEKSKSRMTGNSASVVSFNRRRD